MVVKDAAVVLYGRPSMVSWSPISSVVIFIWWSDQKVVDITRQFVNERVAGDAEYYGAKTFCRYNVIQ